MTAKGLFERNPTEVAACGCPYDPVHDDGQLGWHLSENHLFEIDQLDQGRDRSNGEGNLLTSSMGFARGRSEPGIGTARHCRVAQRGMAYDRGRRD